jgi:hypothetical protein
MGLYLAIFDGDDELDGVEVGSYADFGRFRDSVVANVEGSRAGLRCPTLILHSDCDGEWSPFEASKLEEELRLIAQEFQRRPAAPMDAGWQVEVVRFCGLRIDNLYDCFFDVDGEPLIERLISLAKLSQERKLPITFQ